MRLRLRHVLLAALLAGCGERVLLGGTGGTGGTSSSITATTADAGPPPPDPLCLGRACGSPCQIDPCGGAGACTTSVQPGSCDPNGACVTEPTTCPPVVDCQGQPCGQPCGPCVAGDPTCGAPPGGPFCDGTGQCVPGPIACPCTGPACPPFPCEGAPCGAPCDPCQPQDPTCVWPAPAVCDAHGACLGAEFVLCPAPHDPCAEIFCGALCNLCPPGDPTCVEPPGLKTCDDHRACVMGQASCPDPLDAGPGPDAGPAP